MSINPRSYEHAKDFIRIGQFLVETYRPGNHHDNWLQPRWEYMHYHSLMDNLESALPQIGVWEYKGSIVAIAHFEAIPGDIYFQVHPDFTHLKPEMLEYSETHLSVEAGGGFRRLRVFVNGYDKEFESFVETRGYKKVADIQEQWSAFEIPHPLPPVRLPQGFKLQSLEDENDITRLHRVVYRGFNHPGEPPEDGVWGIWGIKKMQSAPNYRKDLNIVAVAPDGGYASYCGMWLDMTNRIAYVEPVCTDPDYRRMRLGTAVVLEGIRRCGLEGATIAFVGTDKPLYLDIGFSRLFNIDLWTRRWKA